MVKQITRGKDIARNTYWSAVGMTAATMLAVQPVFADTIWDRFSTILKDVYGHSRSHCTADPHDFPQSASR